MHLKNSFSNLFSCGFLRHVSIEPAAFFSFLTLELMNFLNYNLYLQKVCRFNAVAEPDLSTPCDDKDKGILFMSSTYMYITFGFIMVIFFITIFATIYSDLAGKRRKLFIIMPMVGQVLQSISACFQAYFWTLSPLIGIFLDQCFHGFSGGLLCVMVFMNIYVCDNTENEDRNMRLIILNAVRNICGPTGRLLGGNIMHYAGFLKSYLVCLLLSTAGVISAFVFVRNPSETVDSKDHVPNKVRILDVLHAKHIIESFKVILCTQKPRKHKITIVLLLVLGVLVYFPSVGEDSVLYPYFIRRFQWTEVTYGNYSAYRKTLAIVGGLICTFVMSQVLKVHDGVLGMFAGFWDTLAVIGFFFADQEWQIYLIPLFDIFHGVAFSTCYSFASKFFKNHEFGRLQSVTWTFGLLITPSIPIYNVIFQKTMDSTPNAFFLLSIYVNFIVFILYEITYVLSKDVK